MILGGLSFVGLLTSAAWPAHGGQIVVSANTREGVKASALDGMRFRSLGSHHLRGLPEAVQLFQVAARGLPTRFPALRTSQGR